MDRPFAEIFRDALGLVPIGTTTYAPDSISETTRPANGIFILEPRGGKVAERGWFKSNLSEQTRGHGDSHDGFDAFSISDHGEGPRRTK